MGSNDVWSFCAGTLTADVNALYDGGARDKSLANLGQQGMYPVSHYCPDIESVVSLQVGCRRGGGERW